MHLSLYPGKLNKAGARLLGSKLKSIDVSPTLHITHIVERTRLTSLAEAVRGSGCSSWSPMFRLSFRSFCMCCSGCRERESTVVQNCGRQSGTWWVGKPPSMMAFPLPSSVGQFSPVSSRTCSTSVQLFSVTRPTTSHL